MTAQKNGRTLSNQQLKAMRSIAHQLKPVVTVAQNGLTDGVNREIDQALERHELIKLKVAVEDRTARQQICEQICRTMGAELIQSIGSVVVLHRAAHKPDPRLSNLLRFRDQP